MTGRDGTDSTDGITDVQEVTGTAVVSVPVATLWTDPARARPVDRLMLLGDYRGWVSQMTPAQRRDLDGRVESQLLRGEEVLVLGVQGPWAKVLVPGQPAASLNEHGYPGWIPGRQLLRPGDPRARRHADRPWVVQAVETPLRTAPGGRGTVLGHVVLGTRVCPVGASVDGWAPITVAGREASMWVSEQAVRSGVRGRISGDLLLETARGLIGTPYVWGGMTGRGIDCSGLVHIVCRTLGITVPRNADDQHSFVAPVPLGSESPGDLYFFARDGEPAHHVGFATGDGRMLDACYASGFVREGPLTEDRRGTLVGRGTLLSPPPSPARPPADRVA